MTQDMKISSRGAYRIHYRMMRLQKRGFTIREIAVKVGLAYEAAAFVLYYSRYRE